MKNSNLRGKLPRANRVSSSSSSRWPNIQLPTLTPISAIYFPILTFSRMCCFKVALSFLFTDLFTQTESRSNTSTWVKFITKELLNENWKSFPALLFLIEFHICEIATVLWHCRSTFLVSYMRCLTIGLSLNRKIQFHSGWPDVKFIEKILKFSGNFFKF